jgi:hypothetical protein
LEARGAGEGAVSVDFRISARIRIAKGEVDVIVNRFRGEVTLA